MAQRMNYLQKYPKAFEPLYAIGNNIENGSLEKTLRYLVEVRVSQINGCSFCVDTHMATALKNGERQQRLDLLAMWPDLDFFTDSEKAALQLAESITKVGETHVPDEVFAAAREHFDDQEIIDLVMLTVLMNSWNRIAVAFRHTPRERST